MIIMIIKGVYAWILDSAKTRQYRSPVTVCYGLIESSPATKPKGNRQLTHNQWYGNLNPLEVLHIILGHISESNIKRIVMKNLDDGQKFYYDQIRHLKLGLCPTCMMTKMIAFPILVSSSVYHSTTSSSVNRQQASTAIAMSLSMSTYASTCSWSTTWRKRTSSSTLWSLSSTCMYPIAIAMLWG